MVSRHERRDSTFRRLIAMIAERTDLIVATHEATLEEVRTWTGAAQPARTVAIDDAVDFTCWAQDACLPASDADGREVLLLSPSAAKRADRVVAEAVAQEAGLEVLEAPFDFEGGNVLVGPDLVLAGADVGGAMLPEAMTRQSPRLLAIGERLPRAGRSLDRDPARTDGRGDLRPRREAPAALSPGWLRFPRRPRTRWTQADAGRRRAHGGS